MALYDGFFDATQDETTGEYDRAYTSGDFTGYFANVIGSGVCIHNNADSFKAEYEDGTLYLRPGYLFIKGYWLANKAGEGETNYKGYAVTLPTGMTGSMAVVAHLNLGQRLIEIKVQAVSQAYPDALVLAIITADTAEDTRYNTDICSVIDTAGELSGKVEWALNYIDTEIDSKLQQVEADIAAQGAKLDAKIAEVQAVADGITPPPIGSIKFSAAQNVDDTWLKCDGSFVNEADYPELVAALGKLTPSGDKFQLVSNGEIGPQISNGVVYDGRMWVYSYSAKKLYGVDLAGTAAIEEITLTSEDANFNDFIAPSTARPICLSIIPHKVGTGAMLLLTQIIEDKRNTTSTGKFSGLSDAFLVFCAEFSPSTPVLTVASPLTADPDISPSESRYQMTDGKTAVPNVISYVSSGAERYCCIIGGFCSTASQSRPSAPLILDWDNSGNAVVMAGGDFSSGYFEAQRLAFSAKSKGEAVYVDYESSGNQYAKYYVRSSPSSLFEFESGIVRNTDFQPESGREGELPINIAGSDFVLYAFDKNKISYVSTTASKLGTVTVPSPPSAARVFVDAAAYLWGKDIYLIFVGTGIVFSRTLEDGDFGYLDTTSILGTITQFGYLDYDQSEGALYLLGQDTTNTVKVAKIVLNTLYDYANDGAWLPMIASDGVPAWIKAAENKTPSGPTVPMSVTVNRGTVASIYFNGESMISGAFTRDVEENGKFTVGIKNSAATTAWGLKINDAIAITAEKSTELRTTELNVNDYISSGVTLTVYS